GDRDLADPLGGGTSRLETDDDGLESPGREVLHRLDLAVEANFDLAAARLRDRFDLDRIEGQRPLGGEAHGLAGRARNRAVAGEPEFGRLGLRPLQRAVAPARRGGDLEARRAHADVRLASGDVARAAAPVARLQTPAQLAGEEVRRGMAVADLQDHQTAPFRGAA